jgi:LAS superfamily LD-carboxypeptidase LdcB
MRRNKLAWILLAGALCLLLYSIVIMRSDNKTAVILGGLDGAFVESDSITFVDPNASVETPEPTVDIWPQLELSDFDNPQYMIVNAENFLSAAYVPAESAKISGSNNQLFDAKALPELERLLQDCRDAGFTIYVTAAFRSYSYQNNLFNRTASDIADGMGLTGKEAYLDPRYQEAAEKAKKIVAFPGTSEHQLGLAVDLMDKNYSYKPKYEDMNQEMFAWLDAHCAEYGFIKRYPTRKLLLTGWDEPWHYRYVGVEAATFIMEHGICYEEFYAHYHPGFTY